MITEHDFFTTELNAELLMNPNDGEMFSILAAYEDSYQCSIERLDDYLLNAERVIESIFDHL